MLSSQSAQNNNLNIIVSVLRSKQFLSSLRAKEAEKPPDIKTLYSNINDLVKDLDESIFTCKKYNQAKIHRKYEIKIADLEEKIKYLEKKVKQEQRARSPSKKYVEDLLEKLIKFQFESEEMRKQIEQLKLSNEEMKLKIQIYIGDMNNHKINNHQHQEQIVIKLTTNKLNSDNQKPKLATESVQGQKIQQITGVIPFHQINNFLKLKYELRKQDLSTKSSFERFLKKIKDKKTQGWQMRKFLQAIDKWSIELIEYLQRKIPKCHTNNPEADQFEHLFLGNSKKTINNHHSIRKLNETISYRTRKNPKTNSHNRNIQHSSVNKYTPDTLNMTLIDQPENQKKLQKNHMYRPKMKLV